MTDEDRLKQIGENLKKIRESKGDSLEVTATVIDKSPGTVSNYELGKREPKALDLIKFCSHYKVSYTDILDKAIKVQLVKESVEYKNY